MAIPNKFLPTTVFDVTLTGGGKEAKIDSLKIANFTQEGPTKTARGGINNKIIARHGKTTRLEMEDALITKEALTLLFGAEIDPDDTKISVNDVFPGEVKLEGITYVIDEETGARIKATFTVPRFYPDGLLNLTMEAEGDFGVIAIGGEVIADKCGDFYTITFGEKYKDCN